MTYVLFNPDGTIKSYSQSVEGLVLAPGESYVESSLSMEDYAARFAISHQGMCAATVYAQIGDEPIEVEVSAPGMSTVSVDVNGIPQTVQLTNGRGTILIPTTQAMVFQLSPTDRRTCCAAGNGSINVWVGN
jgi:hypothetical protein